MKARVKSKSEEKLIEMVEIEREKVAAYEQIANIHSAYIAMLLEKLGATKDNGVLMTGEAVKKALADYETRATPTGDGWKLYYEVKANKE